MILNSIRSSPLTAYTEVAQQSKIRNKEDFINAFAPVMAEATAAAYKAAPSEIQNKLKRVIDVWRDRSIFEAPIIGAIDSRISGMCYYSRIKQQILILIGDFAEMDKARGTTKPGFGGAPFGGGASIPSALQPIVTAQQTTSKLSISLKSTITTANQEYEKQTDTSTAQPAAPVYAARLNGLLKTLASAENAVAESVKARESLVAGLEQLLNDNRAALDDDRAAATQLSKRKLEIEERKNAVEMGIMQALGPAENNGSPAQGSSANLIPEPERPEMEALTPEMEAITPPSLPDVPQDISLGSGPEDDRSSGFDAASSAPSFAVSNNGSNKRRRIDDSDTTPNLPDDDEIDPEVARMLRDGNI